MLNNSLGRNSELRLMGVVPSGQTGTPLVSISHPSGSAGKVHISSTTFSVTSNSTLFNNAGFSVTSSSFFDISSLAVEIKGDSTFYGSTILSGGTHLCGTTRIGGDYSSILFEDVTQGSTFSDDEPGVLFLKTPVSSAIGYFTVTIDGRDGVVPMFSKTRVQQPW